MKSKIAERGNIGNQSSSLGGGLAKWKALQSGGGGSSTSNSSGTRSRTKQGGGLAGGATVAATGDLLKQRQSLFSDMQKAGAGGLKALKSRARELGVTRQGWKTAKGRLKGKGKSLAPGAVTPPSSPAPLLESSPPPGTIQGIRGTRLAQPAAPVSEAQSVAQSFVGNRLNHLRPLRKRGGRDASTAYR